MQQINDPTLFFPGTLCDERVWMPCWRLMNINQRSYVPLQWAGNLAEMLALANDRLDSFEGKLHLIGYSMGGYIAALCALQRPEKVASLNLIGYSPSGLTQAEMIGRKAIIQAIDARQYKGMNKSRLTHFLTEKELKTETFSSTIEAMEEDLGPAVLRAHIHATTPRKDLTEALGSQSFPINFVAAQHDRVAPKPLVFAAHQAITHSRFFEITDTAHMMLLCQPQKTAQILTDCCNDAKLG